MRTVELFVTELGLIEFPVSESTTLEDLANKENLQTYDFTVDGAIISRGDWAKTNIFTAREIWASKGVKGACAA
jgi:hypothetical protein